MLFRSIEKSIFEFTSLSANIRKNLIKLKEKLKKLLKSINEIIELIPENPIPASSVHNIEILNCIEKYKKLKDAIEKKDMEYIVSNFNNPIFANPFISGDNEAILLEVAKKSIKNLLNLEEFKVLSNSLKEIKPSFNKFNEQYLVKVKSKFIYGICYPKEDCKILCQYDIRNKKLKTFNKVPCASAVTQIEDRIFISGGWNPILDTVSEYIETTHTLVNKKPMHYKRANLTTEVTSPKEFAAIGGYDGSICFPWCEIYSIEKNEWTKLPSLNIKRCQAASSLMNNRYLYIIGGYGSNNEIEMLDLSEMKKWIIVQLTPNEIEFAGSPKSFAISMDEILIFCGQNLKDAAIFDIKDKSVKKCAENLKMEQYFYNSVSIIGGVAYILGAGSGHIHMYDFIKKKFEEISYNNITN